jgi:hypothetical protein
LKSVRIVERNRRSNVGNNTFLVLEDSYSETRKFFLNFEFIKEMILYDPNVLTEEQIELLLPYLEMKEINEKSVHRVAHNLDGIYLFVKALVEYHKLQKLNYYYYYYYYYYYFSIREEKPKFIRMESRIGEFKEAVKKLELLTDQLTRARFELAVNINKLSRLIGVTDSEDYNENIDITLFEHKNNGNEELIEVEKQNKIEQIKYLTSTLIMMQERLHVLLIKVVIISIFRL